MWRPNRVLFGLLALLPLQSLAHCRLTIGYGADPIPPFINKPDSTHLHSPGESISLVTRAASNIGCQIHWLALPNMRVLHATQNGQLDGALFYSWTAERDKRFIYPKQQGVVDTRRSLATLDYMLYKRTDSQLAWDGHTYQQLTCLIGYNEGWSIGADLASHDIAVESAKSAEQNLKKLAKGRICGYATLEQAGDDAIAHYPGNLFAKLPIPLTSKEFYLLVNPESYQRQTAHIEALWDEIGRLAAEKPIKSNR